LIAWLEGRGALGSWRWFTDDPPERLHPWPRFLGLTTEEIDPADVHTLFNRLNAPEIRAQMERHKATVAADPARRLDLSGLPRLSWRGPGLAQCLRRSAVEGLALTLLLAVTAAAAWSRFARYEVP
jgi:hypothetical protein